MSRFFCRAATGLLAMLVLTAAAARAASPVPAGDYTARKTFAVCSQEAAALSGSARADKERHCRRGLALARLAEAARLWNDFAEDPLTAEERYTGKLMAVRGTVTGLGTSPMGYPEVVFGLDGFNVKSVRCQFPSKARAAVDALKIGSVATIGGICKGFVRDSLVRMDSCELLP